MLMRPYAGRTSPWREMERLRREMNRLFNDYSTQARWDTVPSYPAMNVWTDQDSAVVTAELPGVIPDNIDISVEDSTLTLRGVRVPDEAEGATYHRRERQHGAFVRTIQLPFRVATEKVEATFRNGVLSVALPRAAEDKPKKIAIKTG